MPSDDVEHEVERTRKLIARLIRVAGLTRAEVDAQLGEGRGFSTRVLNGIVGLKHEHTLALLQAIGVDPGDFFRLLYPQAEDRTSGGGGSLARLLDQMRRTADSSEDLEEIPAAPEDLPPAASTPFDPEALARRIAAIVREDLGKTKR